MDVFYKYYKERYREFMDDPICNNFLTRMVFRKRFNEIQNIHKIIVSQGCDDKTSD